MKERLQKVIASAGICSRREAERLIAEGEVSVNGDVVKRPGVQVDPSVDKVVVLGRRIRSSRPHVYIALHKPRGVVTTVSDPEGRRKVTDLLTGIHERLFPVGRLDYNAEGLLIMTNDGDLAYRLMRPGGVPKTYRVKVKGYPSPEALDGLRHGMKLDGRPLLPVKVHVESRGETSWLRITLHEGRKNQIVRMMEAIGHPIRRLRRLSVGPVQLAALPAGHWRALTEEEVDALREAAGAQGAPPRARPAREDRPRRAPAPAAARKRARQRGPQPHRGRAGVVHRRGDGTSRIAEVPMKPIPVPDYIASLPVYVPGKPIEEVERELGLSGSAKLASNENPLGASPLALEAARTGPRRGEPLPGRRRVLPQGRPLRAPRGPSGAARSRKRLHGARGTPRQDVPGPGGNAVVSEGAFVMYRIAVAAAGGTCRLTPMTADLRHDLGAMAAAVDGGTRLVYIANPNNPTGTYVTAPEMASFLEKVPEDVLVVVDEAYREYIAATDYPDSLAGLREGRPVVILRTFSKIHGLAGLRIGFAITRPDVAAALERVRSPFNTSSVAQAAALAALDDPGWVASSHRSNLEGLRLLEGELKALGLPVHPVRRQFHPGPPPRGRPAPLRAPAAPGGHRPAHGGLRISPVPEALHREPGREPEAGRRALDLPRGIPDNLVLT